MPDKSPGSCITVGLVNNMPDAALESTERQFSALLDAARGDIAVRLKLFSLPDIPRAEFARQYLDRNYSGPDALRNSQLDGLIVTGTEPQSSALQDEPFWGSLTRVIDWAEDNTISSIWSCLAAHAAVLHRDGIRRSMLGEKQFGVFECDKLSDHPLLSGTPARLRISHSRCNALREDALVARDYMILTRSPEAGVDMFVKQKKSLFVLFQGHPEYDAQALLREYRRDVGRFLRNEREAYPAIPQGYFDDQSAAALDSFRKKALVEKSERLIGSFPIVYPKDQSASKQDSAATGIYRNWLTYLSAQKSQRSTSNRHAMSPRMRRLATPHAVQGLGRRLQSSRQI